ncbi:MAG: MG2 domain-containing protein [Spirochaetes bacterium]|nr:MG2 domain-containing protein [Spirochaetota bacterium]
MKTAARSGKLAIAFTIAIASAAGTAAWEDARTLVFKPSKPLPSGVRYRAVFDFEPFEGKQSSGRYFTFGFETAKPFVSVSFGALRASRSGELELPGTLTASDADSGELVEKALGAKLGGKAAVVSWNHGSDGVHGFVVGGIVRTASEARLVVSWDGAPLKAAARGKEVFRVPAADAFEVLSVRPGQGSDDCVEVAFSSPLDPAQDLRGLIGIDGMEDLRFETDGGLVRVYATMTWPDKARVRVEKGIRGKGGERLEVPAAANVDMSWSIPAVRFASNGVILPSRGLVTNSLMTTKGPSIPVETLNLAAVVVEVFRVYGDNMLQFLQVNDLSGTKELARVGELVSRKTVDLGWKDAWKNKWTTHELDLSDIVRKYPDGMFQVRLTFGRSHIRYICPNDHDFSAMKFPEPAVVDPNDDDSSYWDWSESNAEMDYEQAYNMRTDPCHPAFYVPMYGHDIAVRRNVLVSDIGVQAKRDVDGAWHVTAANLRTVQPIVGAKVSLFNYQQRELASGLTDAKGMIVLKSGGSPFVLAVQADVPVEGAKAPAKQYTWMRVDPAQALAVSHFDIGGEKAAGGVKGLIYGERGVWRPGDDMNLVFLLFDREKRIPADHPVIFELENPQGRVVQTASLGKGTGGFYKIDARTNADAPTGNYIARVKVGDRVFDRTVKVEMVMPNRLKLVLDYGGGDSIKGGLDELGLQASWLHGAPASGLKADVSVVFGSSKTEFTAFKGYSFDDATRFVSSERFILFDDYLDKSGKAVASDFEIDGLGDAPGKLTAYFLSRVFEPSGVFSSEQFSVDYHPYDQYVGVKPPQGDKRGMLLTDQDQAVEIALVDDDGKPVSSGRVDMAIYQIRWRWWWEKGEENLAEYQNEVFNHLVQKGTTTVSQGKGAWKFRVAYPSWGRYLIRAVDKASGHAATSIVYVDWPGWAGRSKGDSGGSAFMLSLSTDKTSYRVGETATVTFPSNADSRALVAVERAGKILREEWIACTPGTTTYPVALGADMSPNVYVHVAFVQPHRSTAPDKDGNDAPIRLYGVVPISVEDPSTLLEPRLKVADTLLPSSRTPFQVTEAKGRAMTYTVAVVDEGLLGITRFRTLDPRSQFYRKEASLLSSFDMYQLVANAFAGKLETLIAAGGGDFGDTGGSRKANRFPPVVQFFGPFELKAGSTADHVLELGPYVGAVRFMVVAGAPQGAYGILEKETPVKAPLMTFATAPRSLSVDEKATIPVTVFSTLGPGAQVKVDIEATGPISVVGEKSKTIGFTQDGEGGADFSVEVGPNPGDASIVVRATGGGKSVSYRMDIPVRSVATPVTVYRADSLDPGAARDLRIDYPGLPGSNELTLELSRYKPINLTGRLAYLIGYPHGCAEQTTSKAFPQLLLPDIVELSPEQSKEASANVAAAIAKLANYQAANGGMTFWPGSSEDDRWLSDYVFHFLTLARKRGFDVPSGLHDRLLDYQKSSAVLWNSSQPYEKAIQAYRLYGLSLSGSPDVANMNRLREFKPLPVQAAFQLAAAYAKAGMKEAAAALISGGAARAESYDGMGYVYGSRFRDTAVVLDAMNAMGDTTRGLPLFNEIADALSSGSAWSTQETAFAFIAAIPYVKATASGAPASAVVTAAGGAKATVKIDKGTARVDLPAGTGNAGSVNVRNDGGAALYLRLVAKGTPKPGNEVPSSNGLGLDVRYEDMDGNDVDPDDVDTGQDLVAFITVSNMSVPKAAGNLALTLRTPSGWEIANYRVSDVPGPEGEGDGKEGDYDEYGNWLPSARKPEVKLFDYQDIRDDRIYTYFDLKGPGDSRTFKFFMNKTYQGIFYLPAITVEAMYDPAVSALEKGRWLGEAKKAPQKKPATGGKTPVPTKK